MIDFLGWLIFAASGRILIQTWFLFPFPPFMKMPYWLEKLHTCDWCAGVWIYSLLAVALEIDIFSLYFTARPTIIGEIVTGVVTSYLVHVFMIGAKEKYSPPIVI